ncbi:MAG: metal-dependent hydrolase [Planctomycetaceae bacterium]|jgi:membrane-bound metal-dependent hydrolase YbcI (DUF457 family)|nr:metal-dependent hydrolase [Planctomycetaceae bacterium]
MTTIEHALLGADLVLATGLNRQFGWQLAALAGACAVLPDWDGLTILWSVPLFDTAHRAWGHGLLSSAVVAVFFALLDYRFDLMQRFAGFFVRLLRVQVSDALLQRRQPLSFSGTCVWVGAAISASYSHLLADIVVSGTATLADWDVKIFFPFSDKGIVYPLVPWGDVGNTIILLSGMFAMLRWNNRVQTIAIIILSLVIAYSIMRISKNTLF